MNTKAVVVAEEAPKVRLDRMLALIEAEQAKIMASLAADIPPKRFLAVARQAITRTPRLWECTPASILYALTAAAELGLEPSGLMGSAYLVPYKNRHTQRYEAQLIPGYRGLIGLARRSGEVRTIEAHVVRARDDFMFEYGSEQVLRHVPFVNLTGERAEPTVDDRGEPRQGALLDGGMYVAAYAFARLTSGEFQFEVMDVAAIEAVRKRSKAADDGPWVTDWAEMARKTPTRRLLKYLPLSVVDLQRALELEDMAESDATTDVKVSTPARNALAASLGVTAPSDAVDVTPEAPDDATVVPATWTAEDVADILAEEADRG